MRDTLSAGGGGSGAEQSSAQQSRTQQRGRGQGEDTRGRGRDIGTRDIGGQDRVRHPGHVWRVRGSVAVVATRGYCGAEPLRERESAEWLTVTSASAVAGGSLLVAGWRAAECTVPNMPCCVGRERRPSGGGKHSQIRPRREPASYTSEKHAGESRPPGQQPRPSSRVRNKQTKAKWRDCEECGSFGMYSVVGGASLPACCHSVVVVMVMVVVVLCEEVSCSLGVLVFTGARRVTLKAATLTYSSRFKGH
ncbi:hypothetical protein E2C01_014321 [Portunus trituberculatus]|uniref:Uncharacterized protein n=1 Tax=Portunus trituberculatus TaxID=210409 RepID=A0A5B7DIW2_PORTR|nr:hypothetical protein [Portunus trituberculatus]